MSQHSQEPNPSSSTSCCLGFCRKKNTCKPKKKKVCRPKSKARSRPCKAKPKRKSRRRCKKKVKKSKRCRGGPITANGYLNFLRKFRRRHCNLPPHEVIKLGAKRWCAMTQKQKDVYNKMACKVSKSKRMKQRCRAMARRNRKRRRRRRRC